MITIIIYATITYCCSPQNVFTSGRNCDLDFFLISVHTQSHDTLKVMLEQAEHYVTIWFTEYTTLRYVDLEKEAIQRLRSFLKLRFIAD